MKRFTCVTGIVFAVMLFLPLAAQAGGTMKISLEEALDIAAMNNSSLKAARARVDQAEAKRVQTRKAFLPKVTLSESFTATNDPASVFTYKLRQGIINPATDFSADALNDPDDISNFQFGLEVQQPIFNLDAIKGRKAAAASRTAREHMLTRTGETVALEVKKAYYGLEKKKKNKEAINSSIRTMRSHDRNAREAFRKGLITESDKLSTAVRLAELSEQKMMIEDAILSAKDALRFLLRLDPDTDIEPVDGFKSRAVAPVDAVPLPPGDRADLKALEASAVAAGYSYEMTRAERLPRVNAFFQQNWNDSDFPGLGESNWMLGVAMEWTLFDGYSAIGKTEEVRAVEREARYKYEEAKDKGMYEVHNAFRRLRTAESRIRVAEQALKEARSSLDFVGSRYRSGQAMTFELLGRETAYTYARMRLNKARYDRIIAESELEYFIGS